MNDKIVVKLDELPHRAERLTVENIQNVFGGCSDFGGSCLKNSDCCADVCKGNQCQTDSPGYGDMV